MLCEIFFSVKLRGSWELRTNPPTQCYITFLNNYSAGQQWEVASLGQIRGGAGWAEGGQSAECTSGIRRAQAGQNRNKTFIFSDNLSWSWYIYSRYTKHARRSNFNFTIDIRDWTLMDSVRINLNYSGSIFVFWCHHLSPEWPLLTDQCHNLLLASVTAPAPRDHDWDLWCSCK